MTNAEIIRTIRTEVRRMANIYNYVEFFEADLLDFLETLEKSEKPTQEGLEEEIAGMYRALFGTDIINRKEMLYLDTFEAIARHFAQWGADHTPLPEDTVLFNKGVEEGKRLMMEDFPKWLVDDDYFPQTDKGKFILGSVGLGYNGYYIPYSDLLKLPKEDEK